MKPKYRLRYYNAPPTRRIREQCLRCQHMREDLYGKTCHAREYKYWHYAVLYGPPSDRSCKDFADKEG